LNIQYIEKFLNNACEKSITMKLTIDLRHDEIADLHKAQTLISEALAERTGQKPATSQTQQQSATTQNHTPTIDQLRQQQQSSSQSQSSQPTSTGLFAPRPAQNQSGSSSSSAFLPQSPPRSTAPAASNNQDSFNMLNILGRKK